MIERNDTDDLVLFNKLFRFDDCLAVLGLPSRNGDIDDDRRDPFRERQRPAAWNEIKINQSIDHTINQSRRSMECKEITKLVFSRSSVGLSVGLFVGLEVKLGLCVKSRSKSSKEKPKSSASY